MPRTHKPENAHLPATPKAAGYARDLAAERGMGLQTAAEAHGADWPLTYASANALIRALKATPRPSTAAAAMETVTIPADHWRRITAALDRIDRADGLDPRRDLTPPPTLRLILTDG